MDIFNKAMGKSFEPIVDIEKYNSDIIEESIACRKELKKIENKRNLQSIEERNREALQKFNREQHIYEEYDPASFETKLRLDALFFEHVFDNLPETDGVESAVGSFYRTVREIYEMINIKPENHRRITTSLLIESVSEQGKIFNSIVMEHLNNKLYRVTPSKRKEKYFEESKDLASSLITSGVSADDAIAFAIKSTILESLIQSVAIPKQIQSRVKYLCESKEYGQVFDQDKLKNLWESFNIKSKHMSKILAAAV